MDASLLNYATLDSNVVSLAGKTLGEIPNAVALADGGLRIEEDVPGEPTRLVTGDFMLQLRPVPMRVATIAPLPGPRPLPQQGPSPYESPAALGKFTIANDAPGDG